MMGGGPLLLLWIVLAVLSRLMAAVVSPIRPLTALEQAVALWPPAPPYERWLERALIAPWVRWDAEWYGRIVEQGYRAGDGTLQFYPLYPLLALPLARRGLSPAAALTLVSLAASLGVMRLLPLVVDGDLPAVRRAALLLWTFPTAFVLFAPYAEAVFLCMAIGSFAAMGRGRWGWAGLAAALAALARPQGIFLGLPLAWTLARQRALRSGGWALALPALGFGGWHFYRIAVWEGLPPPGSGLHDWIYGLLLSPSATRVVPVQAFLPPWEAMGRALERFAAAPDLDLGVNLAVALWWLLLAAAAWGPMTGAERLYTAAVALAAFSYHTGPVHPYMGLPRHLFLAFPVFTALGRRPARWIDGLPIPQMAGWSLLIGLYGLHTWVT
ncbi:MAG: hypothetical protein C4313_01770 [Thermoflexus sp.]